MKRAKGYGSQFQAWDYERRVHCRLTGHQQGRVASVPKRLLRPAESARDQLFLNPLTGSQVVWVGLGNSYLFPVGNVTLLRI